MNITGRVKLGQLLIRRKVSPGSTKTLVHFSGNIIFRRKQRFTTQFKIPSILLSVGNSCSIRNFEYISDIF